MATSRTFLYELLVITMACSLSLAAPAADARSTTNSNAPKGGWGSKLLYQDAVEVVDNMHEFLSTLSEFEEVKAGEGAREAEMIRYGVPTRSKKDSVGFQMPSWRRRRRSTVEEDLVSTAYFGRLDDQADDMVKAIHTFMGDLQKVRQFYEGMNVFRDNRQYHLGDSRGLSQADSQLPAQE